MYRHTHALHMHNTPLYKHNFGKQAINQISFGIQQQG